MYRHIAWIFGLANSVNNQPIQQMGKITDGRRLWSFLIWHESLLQRLRYEIVKFGGKFYARFQIGSVT